MSKLPCEKSFHITADGVTYGSVETPEGDFTKKPGLNYKIRSIQTELGAYAFDDEYFEFKSSRNKSDAIEMELDDFIRLADELPKVMRILGVKL